MTTYQLRTHYLFYRAVKLNFPGDNIRIADREEREKLKVFIPMDSYLIGMDFNSEEDQNRNNLIAHAIWGMNKEDLINNDFVYGPVEFVKRQFTGATVPGIIFTPTILGVELFLWSFGSGHLNYEFFFKSEFHFEEINGINIGPTQKI